MRRIIGPILALFGILAIIGVATGAAYTAGLNAATVTAVTANGATTAVVPVVGYGWYGAPWLGFGFGFGQFLFMLLGFFLIVALLRFAFGGGRRGRGYGWGPGWGPGYGRGPGGWDHHGTDGGPAGSAGSGDPREAWIRGRLDEWHRTAHATADGAGGSAPAPSGPSGTMPSGPSAPPAAG
jgi:hypothetical protein